MQEFGTKRFWCRRQVGRTYGFTFQIAQDIVERPWNCGDSVVLDENAYHFITPALRKALSSSGWNYDHFYGRFSIPQNKVSILAGHIAKLHCHRVVGPMWVPNPPIRFSSVTIPMQVRTEIVRFLLQSERLGKQLTILGV